jgi:tetratricopeptide (TPR) repeat protein
MVAQLARLQGKQTEAEELLTQARKGYLAARGEDDPKTLDVTASLGLVLAQNQPDLAERMLVDVLNRSQRALGLEHPLTSISKECLSDVYFAVGKKDEAIRLLIEVNESRTKVLGRNHPETLISMVKLGIYSANQGDLDRAESLLTEALAGCRTALDRNHDTTDGALAGLANVYLRRKDMKRVSQVLIEAAEIARRRWGADSGYTMNANWAAGGFLVFQREYAKAEPYLRDSLRAMAKPDPDRGDHFFTELLLGVCLLAQKNYSEANSHFLIGYNGIKQARDKTPPLERADLGWLLEQVDQLRDANGGVLVKTSMLSILKTDPGLQAIVLDLQFPADVFAPP